MSLLDDGSNESLLVTLVLGSIICAALSVVRAMRHVDLAIRTAWDGDDTLQLTCPCEGCNAFYGERREPTEKPWWKP